MGQRYESKKKSVSENKESMETNVNEQVTLREEYSILSSLDGLISDLEDETMEVVGHVEAVGESEGNRLEDEKEEILEEREDIVDEIEGELDKLQSGLRKMEQLDKFEFGSKANDGAKSEYKKMIEKYSDLIGELDQDAKSSFSGEKENVEGHPSINDTIILSDEEAIIPIRRVDPNELWKQTIVNVDEIIENYKEALLNRGVPDGKWLNDTLAIHRARMLEQEGYNIDVLSGHKDDSVNRADAYVYPSDYAAFYDSLADEYGEYAISHHEVINGKNMVESFKFNASKASGPGQQAAELQGFLGKPLIVTNDVFDDYVEASGIKGYRTFSAGQDVVSDEWKSSEYYAAQLREGEEFRLNGSGRQVYGEGTYFAINHNYSSGVIPNDDDVNFAFQDSRAYGHGDDITTVVATVRSDTTIRDFDEVLSEFKKLEPSEQVRFGGRRDGVAAYAISQGIDALVHRDWDLDYMILYNRTKLIIREANQ